MSKMRAKISVVQSKTAFSLDPERQCRARGHVYARDFRHLTGEYAGQFEHQTSEDCFRCGAPLLEAVQ